jgi:acyl-CoA thioester hydrolase
MNIAEKNLIYSYEFQVQESDIDQLNHVNNVVYVQWIQDAAIKHWSTVAPEKAQKDYVWVIVRHEIDYRKPGKSGDQIHIKTWVLNASGISSVRQVQIFRKKDMQLLVESKTTWCMLDAKTHRPVRITNEIRNIFLGE